MISRFYQLFFQFCYSKQVSSTDREPDETEILAVDCNISDTRDLLISSMLVTALPMLIRGRLLRDQ